MIRIRLAAELWTWHSLVRFKAVAHEQKHSRASLERHEREVRLEVRGLRGKQQIVW